MKSTFKPYRLINDIELHVLQQAFEHKLQQWNAAHALYPLSCSLTRLTLEDQGKARVDCTAFVKTDCSDLSIIKHSVFGDLSDCFNDLTETLFNDLLAFIIVSSNNPQSDNWFYLGSPALALTLNNAIGNMKLYIHPQWVLNALPLHDVTKKPITPLHDALEQQQLSLHVELTPLSLKLADIIHLQVGNLIKTDHVITEPARLTHQQYTICKVDLGQANAFKSIQIEKRS